MATGEATPLRTLVSVCRADLNDEPIDIMGSIRSEEEWISTIACVEEHGLLGLLYRAAVRSDTIPSAAWKMLRHAVHQQAARSCFCASELLQIIDSFGCAGIDSLCVKGPALAWRAYGHFSDRQSCDLDILVRRRDLRRAIAVIEQRGYRTMPGLPGPDDPPEPDSYHFVFLRQSDAMIVELHWALTSGYQRAPIDATGVWSRAQDVLIGGRPVRTLAIEDALLHLCVHGYKHEWNRIKWWTDIAYLLRCGVGIDWCVLLARARETGCTRILLIGLHLASQVFGAPLPAPVAGIAAADRKAAILANQVSAAVLSGAGLTTMESMVFNLHARERVRDRLVLSARLIRRIFRLTKEDGEIGSKNLGSLVILALKRPLRLYRTYGTSWLRPAIRLR